ncbi:right-handed parallel beta-helix repeat-containing protein [bacterium]|nr:right-handed parallel beta-helix repeat-containing protein [bacterium]
MMKNRKITQGFLMLAIFALLLMPVKGFAGNLEPSGPPASTMKTLDEVEPRTPISSLPYIVTTAGSYYLTSNLTSTGKGIDINVDNVTIDLMGFTMTGPGTAGNYGIEGVDIKNLTIKNGTITNFALGVWLPSPSGRATIDNIKAAGNMGNGIDASNGSIVKNCTASDNGGYGIVANDSVVRGNTANNNGNAGVLAHGSSVVNNTASFNAGSGFYGGGTSFINNTSSNNTVNGFTVLSGTILRGNSSTNNSAMGINLSSVTSPGAMIDGNIATGNTSANMNSCILITCTYGLNHTP